MAELIGRVVEVESADNEKFSNRNFGRSRIKVEVDKPLVSGFFSPRPDSLEDVWIRVKYEKLTRFCFNCGKLGHESRACEDEENEEVGVVFYASMCTLALREFVPAPASRPPNRQPERNPQPGASGSHDGFNRNMCHGSNRERQEKEERRKTCREAERINYRHQIIGSGSGIGKEVTAMIGKSKTREAVGFKTRTEVGLTMDIGPSEAGRWRSQYQNGPSVQLGEVECYMGPIQVSSKTLATIEAGGKDGSPLVALTTQLYKR